MSLPKTRKEAKAQGSKLYNTGKPCKYGHYADRYTSARRCVECVVAYQGWHHERLREYNAAYRSTPEGLERERSNKRAWKKANKGSVNSDTAKRHAAKLQRTPKWLTADDHAQIKAVYEQAQRLTECLGVEFQVDHIHPLQGKNVSGLHAPWNLQVITATANRQKGNRFD